MAKNQSALVSSVIALDEQFSNLVQLGSKIEALNLKSSNEFDQVEHLIEKFNEVAIGVGEHIGTMSLALNEARAQAEAAATQVANKANEFNTRKTEIQKKMDEFRILGEKVSLVTMSLADLKPMAGQDVSDEERAKITERFAEVGSQLQPLIAEARQLKDIAQESRIKLLEQSADAMWQSLTAVSRKLSSVTADA